MGINMDRRQRKTRQAIFEAFTQLLAKKDVSHITVGEIIDKADIGRATFYSHFETKDLLLKEYCRELFCHIFDVENNQGHQHKHIFECDGSESIFLHLFQHLQKNDNNILTLMSCPNNELFLKYFKDNLALLIQEHPFLSESCKDKVPLSFWKHHVASSFVETVKWWINNGMQQSPEVITEYFQLVIK